MIDFQNATFFKLKPVSDNDFAGMIFPIFVPGEQIIQSFRGVRDGVVFTKELMNLLALNTECDEI